MGEDGDGVEDVNGIEYPTSTDTSATTRYTYVVGATVE